MNRRSIRSRTPVSTFKIFNKNDLGAIYRALTRRFGPQHWWPAESPFEVMVGAVLTQNTSWRNVERALENLKAKNLLSPKRLYSLPQRQLARLIRPSGFFRLKAKRLAPLVGWFYRHYQGSTRTIARQKTPTLRQELLNLPGIGPETADSILLYAFDRPVFVVDAYTRRVFSRHQLFDAQSRYADIQELFMSNLPTDHKLYNDYHALVVQLAKTYCQSSPRCAECPLA